MRHNAQQYEFQLSEPETVRVLEVPGPALAATLAEEQAHGWRVVTMDVKGLAWWRVTLEREVAGSLGTIVPKPATESQVRPHAEEQERTPGRAGADKESFSLPATGYLQPPA